MPILFPSTQAKTLFLQYLQVTCSKIYLQNLSLLPFSVAFWTAAPSFLSGLVWTADISLHLEFPPGYTQVL